MIKTFLLLMIAIHIMYRAEELQLNFFQNDYDINMDRAECSWFNKSCAKYFNFSLVLYNRTQRVIKTDLELLIDMGRNTILDIQLYKMMSNEYRFFPVTFRANFCVEYTKDSFGFRNMLARTSNVNPCNMKKGIYYIRNAIPDFSRYPPHLPTGSYKLVHEFLFGSSRWAQVDFYGRIVDKPIDWKNIPKTILN
ncbi:hypothetical protein ILUMI_22515 [Ignelater luminosus]|uniref:Uncharacterized protein n=1 Tax=Ignelater luminosus TaxID=2038154 RepID=A0A8K0CAG7_IGNLU|nr:hypothetical protein ILUMI_22515 [Ignelater luminosus]